MDQNKPSWLANPTRRRQCQASVLKRVLFKTGARARGQKGYSSRLGVVFEAAPSKKKSFSSPKPNPTIETPVKTFQHCKPLKHLSPILKVTCFGEKKKEASNQKSVCLDAFSEQRKHSPSQSRKKGWNLACMKSNTTRVQKNLF